MGIATEIGPRQITAGCTPVGWAIAWYAIHTKDLTQLGSIAAALLAGLAGAGLAPRPSSLPRELRPGARA
ncbi:MAG: hypothetical protein R3F43_05115 [bacterium]